MSPQIRSYALPAAMLIGILLHEYVSELYFLIPYAIFIMLLISFSNLSVKELKLSRIHLAIPLWQLGGSIAIYLLLRGIDENIAQGAMICVLAPSAITSPMVGSIIGGNIKTMSNYLLLSSIVVALAVPTLFPLLNISNTDIELFTSFLLIFKKVGMVLLVPLAIIWLLERFAPKAHHIIQKGENISFFIWVVSVAVLIGKTSSNILDTPSDNRTIEWILGGIGLLLCIAQFSLGHKWGSINGDAVAGAQSMGQKNTSLAVWIALAYMNPLAAIAPTSYIIWQNLTNSFLLWRANHKTSHREKSC